MPGNTVSVNLGWREYYVADSKMPEVLACLRKNGVLIKEPRSVRPIPWNKFAKRKVGRTASHRSGKATRPKG